MTTPDPWRTLGLEPGASLDEAKEAYKRMAMKYHPDRCDQPDAKERFQQVQAAYRAIESGTAQWKRDIPDGTSFERDLWSVFNQVFDTGTETSGVWKTTKAKNWSITIKVDLDDIAKPTKFSFKHKGEEREFYIPPLAEHDKEYRIQGKGERRTNDDRGDLLVRIKIKHHPVFVRMSKTDLGMEVPVKLTTALKGGRLTVPTLYGKRILTIPPRAKNGQLLKVVHGGLRHKSTIGDDSVGDLGCVLKVMLPDNFTSLPQELQDALDDDRNYADVNAWQKKVARYL